MICLRARKWVSDIIHAERAQSEPAGAVGAFPASSKSLDLGPFERVSVKWMVGRVRNCKTPASPDAIRMVGSRRCAEAQLSNVTLRSTTGRDIPNRTGWLPGMGSNHELDRSLKSHNLLVLQSRRSRQKHQKQASGTKSVQKIFHDRASQDLSPTGKRELMTRVDGVVIHPRNLIRASIRSGANLMCLPLT